MNSHNVFAACKYKNVDNTDEISIDHYQKLTEVHDTPEVSEYKELSSFEGKIFEFPASSEASSIVSI